MRKLPNEIISAYKLGSAEQDVRLTDLLLVLLDSGDLVDGEAANDE